MNRYHEPAWHLKGSQVFMNRYHEQHVARERLSVNPHLRWESISPASAAICIERGCGVAGVLIEGLDASVHSADSSEYVPSE